MIELRPKQTIAFDGDSLTALRSGPALDQWPWLRLSNNHRSWADHFAELLFAWRPELDLTFRTVAVGGSSCTDVIERFDAMLAKIRPDWVLLTLGSNDARRGVPLADFEAALRDYAGRIGAWGGRVVFLYNIQACPGASEANLAKADLRSPYDAVEEKLARELGHVQVLDVGTPLKSKAEELHQQYTGHSVYSDGTHFSNLGALILAGEVLKACGVVAG